MLKRCLHAVHELDQLIRLHQLGFVALWPMLGLACVDHWTPQMFVAVTAVALFLNSFGIALNDVVDAPIDKTAPLRRQSPLVSGKLTSWQGLSLSVAQLLLMFSAHVASGLSMQALPLLAGVACCVAVYDLWSKTTPVPLLIDAVLGLSGFLFVLYGARITGAPLPPLVWPLAVSAAAFLMYVNAYCNGLRDLENDRSCGGFTVPIWLGCEAPPGRRLQISFAMSLYAGFIQAALIGLALLVAMRTQDDAVGPAMTGVVVASAANGALLLFEHRATAREWAVLMRLHLVILPLPVMLAMTPLLGRGSAAALFALYFGALFALAPGLLLDSARVGRWPLARSLERQS